MSDPRTGAIDLSDVAAALHRTFGAEGPRANYSGLAAVKDQFVRNGLQSLLLTSQDVRFY